MYTWNTELTNTSKFHDWFEARKRTARPEDQSCGLPTTYPIIPARNHMTQSSNTYPGSPSLLTGSLAYFAKSHSCDVICNVTKMLLFFHCLFCITDFTFSVLLFALPSSDLLKTSFPSDVGFHM